MVVRTVAVCAWLPAPGKACLLGMRAMPVVAATWAVFGPRRPYGSCGCCVAGSGLGHVSSNGAWACARPGALHDDGACGCVADAGGAHAERCVRAEMLSLAVIPWRAVAVGCGRVVIPSRCLLGIPCRLLLLVRAVSRRGWSYMCHQTLICQLPSVGLRRVRRGFCRAGGPCPVGCMRLGHLCEVTKHEST